MSNNVHEHPLETSYKSLKLIKNITLTPRQIDVVACLISGKRRARTIASFLSTDFKEIKPRTIEAHMRDIRLRLNCYSQEGILTFIEEMGKISAFRQHYLLLNQDAYFHQKITDISKKTKHIIWDRFKRKFPKILRNFDFKIPTKNQSFKKKFSSCLILYGKEIESWIKPLTKVLALLEIEAFCYPIEKIKGLQETLPKASFDQCLVLNSLDTKDISPLLKDSKAVISMSFRHQDDVALESDQLNLASEIYYLSVLKIVKKLFPSFSLDFFILDFERYRNQLKKQQSAFSFNISQEAVLPQSNSSFKKVFVVVMGAMIFVGFLHLFMFYKKEHISPQNVSIKKTTINPIRSDLLLPQASVLLNRSEILKQMQEKLTGNKGIQTLALVGIGGSGKTTLARHYAQIHPATIIWEINAETHTNLRHAFEDLAFALAQREDDKRFLKNLDEVKDTTEKERQILHFVKDKLKLQKEWLLIFDNVEQFFDLQAYFPATPDQWGHGKVIVTTRDSHLQTHPCISHSLMISELTADEKLTLFTQIIDKEQGRSLNQTQINEAKKFLIHIAPFPLDVSIASYYVRATDVTYDKYLDHVHHPDQNFIKMQEEILKDMSDYTKTRYRLITLSIQQMIQQEQDFHDLLLLISLIDSQDIPLDLLYTYKDHAVVDHFIHHLKKYSLITHLTKGNHKHLNAFSLHRSTQDIMFHYLNFSDNKASIQAIGSHLETYMCNSIETEDFNCMKLLIQHVQVFLSYQDLLTNKIRHRIQVNLGKIYHYLGYYQESQKLLEETLSHSYNFMDYKEVERADILYYLGEIYGSLGKRDQSIQCLEESLALYEKCIPFNYKKIAQLQASLGNTYIKKNYLHAKELLEKSLTLYKSYLHDDYVNLAWIYLFLGYAEESQGHFLQAKHWFEQSLAVCQRYLINNPVKIAWALANIGNMERELGNYQRAHILLQQSYDLCQLNLSDQHRGFAILRVYRGILERTCGRYEKAEEFFTFAASVFRNLYSLKDPWCAWVLAEKGILRREQGELEQSRVYLEQAIEIYQKSYGKKDIKTAKLLKELGHTYFLQNNWQKSEDLLKVSFSILKAHQHEQSYQTLEILSDLYFKKSKDPTIQAQQVQVYYNQSLDYLKQSLEIVRTSFPEESAHITRLKKKLVDYK